MPTGLPSDDRAAAIGIGVAVTFLLSIIIGVTIGVVLTWCVIRQRLSKSYGVTVEGNSATDISLGTVMVSNPSFKKNESTSDFEKGDETACYNYVDTV